MVTSEFLNTLSEYPHMVDSVATGTVIMMVIKYKFKVLKNPQTFPHN